MKIKYLPVNDRPYEKAFKNGISSLSDSELLSVIINSGNNKCSALEISKTILSSEHIEIKNKNGHKYICENKENYNHLHKLANMKIEELMQFKGIGKVKAIRICAALELGRRTNLADKFLENISLLSPANVCSYISKEIGYAFKEIFICLYLDHKLNLIKETKISNNNESQVNLDVTNIFSDALKFNCQRIIIAHNHPSGNLQASIEDINTTKKFIEICKLLNIEFLDHIIVYKNLYYSFKEKHMDLFL